MKRRLEETLPWELDAEERKPNIRRSRPQPERVSISLLEHVRQEIIDLTLSDSEEEHGKQEIVDLTLESDSDEESEPEPEPKLEEAEDVVPSLDPRSPHSEPTAHGTTLLTPIATTLKADRLGIGLKAARRSKFKAKAVTHTSAALAAHIRSGNQARKQKARHGRGSRGFARGKHKEAKERVDMLAYMNS